MLRTVLIALAALGLLATLAACGSVNTGTEPFPSISDDVQHSGSGVTLGGFEVIRHNTAGDADPVLNSTLRLGLAGTAAAPELVISVDDSERTNAVTLDVYYNSARYTPAGSEFAGLVGNADDTLRISVASVPGRIGLGEAATGSARASLSGEFATVRFAPGPARGASAFGSFVHGNPDGVAEVIQGADNLTSTSDPGAGTASVSWTAGWHIADGDANSEISSADIVPIATLFGQSVNSNYAAITADYDRNTEVSVADLQPIALYFGNRTAQYVVEASDDEAGAARTSVATVSFLDDKLAPAGPATPGNLASAYEYWEVNFNAASPVTYETLAGLDGNGNSSVSVWITPQWPDGQTTDGTEASIAVDVTPTDPQITGITVALPGSVTLEQQNGDWVVLLTERSVDGIQGNAEAFTYDSIPLEATVTTNQDPLPEPFTAEDLIWTVVEGGGLAEVSNEEGEHGTVTFNDRGRVTIEARAPGSFTTVSTISFLLLSIETLELELAAGGTGPVNADSGDVIGFTANGTFALDTELGQVTQTLDITPYCGWGVLTEGGTYSFDTNAGELDLAGSLSGSEYNVTCEFPPTDDVTLYDNQKRFSNFVTVIMN